MDKGGRIRQPSLDGHSVPKFTRWGKFKKRLIMHLAAAKSRSSGANNTHGMNQPPRRVINRKFHEDQLRPAPLHLTDIEAVRALGSGSYGTVFAARVRRRLQPHKLDVEGAMMAVKLISKREIRFNEPEDYLLLRPCDDTNNYERRFLSSINWHPFVSGLLFCAVDPRNFYLVQELGVRGTLGQRIASKPLPTDICRFYFANLVIAVEFIHDQGVVHSDIKPENIFIREDGYLMIGDFGLTDRVDSERDWGHVGTTQFMPPECIGESVPELFRRAIDYWSLFVVLYEMATGKTPFPPLRHTSGNASFVDFDHEYRIFTANWRWPKGIVVDSKLKALIESGLCRPIDKRIGTMCPTDIRNGKNREIRNSEFMRDFPWDKMERRELLAPFVGSPVPNYSLLPHRYPLPAQKKLPHLHIVKPPPHLAYINRRRPVNTASESAVRKRRHDGDPKPGGDDRPRKKRREVVGVMRRSRSTEDEIVDLTADGSAGSTESMADKIPMPGAGRAGKRRRSVEDEPPLDADFEDQQARQMAFRTKRRRYEESEAASMLARRENYEQDEEDNEEESQHLVEPADVVQPSPTVAPIPVSVPAPPPTPTMAPTLGSISALAATVPPPKHLVNFEASAQQPTPQTSLWRSYTPTQSTNAMAGPSRAAQPRRTPPPATADGETSSTYRPTLRVISFSRPRNLDFEALPQASDSHAAWRPALPPTLQKHTITGPINNLPPLRLFNSTALAPSSSNSSALPVPPVAPVQPPPPAPPPQPAQPAVPAPQAPHPLFRTSQLYNNLANTQPPTITPASTSGQPTASTSGQLSQATTDPVAPKVAFGRTGWGVSSFASTTKWSWSTPQPEKKDEQDEKKE